MTALVGRRRIRVFIFVFILLVSVVLRIYQIGTESYWIDEMTSVHFASYPSVISIFWDNCPFLYHLLLKIWVAIFGDREFSTRFLSLIFSTATTFVLMKFGERRFGPKGAAVFGALHAVFPLSITYAQETRMYALFEFAAAVNFYYFDRFWREGRNQSKYVASAVLLSLTHYLSLVPLFMQGVFFLASREHRPRLKGAFIAIVAVAVVFALSYFAFFSWAHLEWQRLGYSLDQEEGSNVLIALLFGNPVSSAAAIGLLILGALFSRRFSIRKEMLFSGTFALGSAASLIVVGALAQRLVYFPRYFIFLVPVIVVLAGLILMTGFNQGGRAGRIISAMLGLIIVGGAAASLPDVYRQTKAPWNLLAAEVARSNSKLAFTSRTLSIETPYFRRAGISVQKLRPTPTGLKDLIDSLGNCQTAWVVDTYWGGLGYFPDLEKALVANQIQFQEQSFKTDYSDTLVALKITSLCK